MNARGITLLEGIVQDIAYGTRQFRRSPLVTVTVIVTLAIAIGANTTIFTLANALLLRDPAGVRDPGQLVDIGVSYKGLGFSSTSYPNYQDLAQRATSFDGIYAHPRFPNSVRFSLGADTGERAFVTRVSSNYFTVLGTVPAAGRLFDRIDDTKDGGSETAVLSYSFWSRRFGRDLRIVGQTVRLNEKSYTVVGVADEGFIGTGVRAPDIWLPLEPNSNRAGAYLLLGGRLKRDVPLEKAAAELQVIGRALQDEYPADNRDKEFRPAPLSPLPGEQRPVGAFIGLLMAIVAVVLAIACANVSGVVLARAVARRQEIAVRLSIGAARARIIRQLLTETMLLFGVGAAAGLFVAQGLTSVLSSLLPSLPFPIELSLSLDSRVAAFTLAVSFIASILCGLAPALQATKSDTASAMKKDAGSGVGSTRLRNVFVFAQVTLSILLMMVGGLFIRALQRATLIDPGFDVDRVELASLDLSMAGFDATSGTAYARDLIERVRRLPGVEAATIATVLPGGFEGIGLGGLAVPGTLPPDGVATLSPTWNVIEPGYFATLHIPILDGRDFTNDDRTGNQSVIVIGEGAARTFWPGQRAVGKYIERRNWASGSRTPVLQQLLVVGVARDPKFGSLVDGTAGIYAYLPLQQEHLQVWTMIAARSRDGRRLTEDIRTVVAATNPNVLIESTQTGKDYAALGLAPWRIAASTASSLGVVGLLLATIGIYGVTAFAVTRRTKEIGIRIALGAKQWNVLGIVLRQGMSVVGAGIAAGFILAGAAGRLLVSFLFGGSALDPLVFSSGIALFAAIGFIACYIPARRATRIDPMNALRNE